MDTLLPIAQAYWNAGLCPLPRVVGHPEPSFVDQSGVVRAIAWGEYKGQRPDWPVVPHWFTRSDPVVVGITLLTGSHAQPRAATAAFLQILDLESAEVFEALQESLLFGGHADIWHRCIIERTPSQGAHIGFLCPFIGETQKVKLATRAADKKLLIELLQHQPCTVAPTSIQSKPEHPAGVPYRLVQRDWAQPLEISPAQRQALLDCARAFNEVPEAIRSETMPLGTGDRPGDQLNTQADAGWWHALLMKYGWRDVSRPGLRGQGVYYFQRPGKVGNAPSATYGATGPYLYTFSTNAWPFEADTAYAPFSAYALLEHAGNYQQAAAALARQGYGERGYEEGRPALLRPQLRALPMLWRGPR